MSSSRSDFSSGWGRFPVHVQDFVCCAPVEKKLDGPVAESRGMGSFDCVRLAPHFAHDDREGLIDSSRSQSGLIDSKERMTARLDDGEIR
jgi:hypothetical protein